MPQIVPHPHPINPEIRCETCKFWHTTYKQKMAADPRSPEMWAPLEALTKAGAISGNLLQATLALCWFNPQWVKTKSVDYCSHWEPKPH